MINAVSEANIRFDRTIGTTRFSAAPWLASAPMQEKSSWPTRPTPEFNKVTRGVARTFVGTVVALTATLNSPTMYAGGHHEVLQFESAQDLNFPLHQRAAVAEMQSYRGLPAGWDGPGSVGPSDETIDAALVFLSSLSPATKRPEAGATSEGSAEWYWRSQHGRAAVSFRNNRMTFYVRVGDKVESGSVRVNSLAWPAELLRMLQTI